MTTHLREPACSFVDSCFFCIGLSGLLRHTCQLLLNALAEVDRDAFAQVKSQLDLEALFGVDGETKEFRLERSQRKDRLQQAAIAAFIPICICNYISMQRIGIS